METSYSGFFPASSSSFNRQVVGASFSTEQPSIADQTAALLHCKEVIEMLHSELEKERQNRSAYARLNHKVFSSNLQSALNNSKFSASDVESLRQQLQNEFIKKQELISEASKFQLIFQNL
jgi:hypothetical protein